MCIDVTTILSRDGESQSIRSRPPAHEKLRFRVFGTLLWPNLAYAPDAVQEPAFSNEERRPRFTRGTWHATVAEVIPKSKFPPVEPRSIRNIDTLFAANSP